MLVEYYRWNLESVSRKHKSRASVIAVADLLSRKSYATCVYSLFYGFPNDLFLGTRTD